MDPRVNVFNRDALNHGGYLYTSSARLSCRLATTRSTEAILETRMFPGRSVLDIACGDGYYTIQFFDRGKPSRMVGVDLAFHAVRVAHANKQTRSMQFVVGDAHRLPWPDNTFDMVLVQSILHHDDHPAGLIQEAFRVAPLVLIHEPNGNNLGLMIIERLSRYHREHHERSYTPSQLDLWIREAGGSVLRRRFAGFVPMFCPDSVARLMKAVEPILERIPLLRALACAVVVITAVRSG